MIIESFDGQREDEEITATWRQHPWVLMKPSIVVAVIIVLGSLPEAIWSPSWGITFMLLFTVVALLYGLMGYYLWLNTIYVLTNQRIFAITQKALFYRLNTEVPLVNIQNVSHSQKGPGQMLLGFGNVEVETSGAKTAMSLKNVEKPYRVQQKILARQEKQQV